MHKFEGVVFRKGGGGWRLTCLLAALVLLLGMYAGSSAAQTTNGQISGTVTDPSGAVIVGAKVTLTYELTNQQHQLVTGSSGDFFFPDLVSGTYDVTVDQSGFQTYSQKGISLAVNEKMALHAIQLTVGNVSTEVTVQASMAHVETDTSEHSALVNSAQMTDITVKGRNYMSYVALLPGVTNTSPGGGDAPGWGNSDGETVNGGNNTVVVMLNGTPSQDDGNNTLNAYLAPSADAIQEMNVQTNAMNAEYGSRNGGQVDVVYKTGTRNFHGSLFDYDRNTMFNANSYFDKLLPTSNYYYSHPAHYDYQNPGGTIGGPFWIPKVPFNRNRDKLFLFFSADILKRNVPASQNPVTLTVPTVNERLGNFAADSIAVPAGAEGNTSTVAAIPMYCPGVDNSSGAIALSTAQVSSPAATAAACAGSPNGSTVAKGWAPGAGGVNPALNLFPLPNCNSYTDLYNAGIAGTANPGLSIPACGTGSSYTNGYNFQQLLIQKQPRSDYILTGQYNLAQNELWTVDLTKDYQCTCGGNFLGGSGWPSQLLTDYQIHSTAATSDLVSTIRPNLINDLNIGTTRALQTVNPDNASISDKINIRNNVGLGPSVLPVLFPDPASPFGANAQSKSANPYGYLPRMTFATSGLNNPVSIVEDGRWPFFGTDTHYLINDQLTWVKGAHALKFGFYWEKVSRNGPSGGGGGDWSGNVNFGQSTTNPFDTGFGFMNAYYGIFQSYDEESDHPLGYDRWHSEEWFAQDTWKVTRHLTLDYGVRFQHLNPTYDVVETSDFQPNLYNAGAQAPLLIPCKIGGVRVAAYPNCTSPTYTTTQSAVGDFVPSTVAGVIKPFQGMQAFAPRQHVMNTPGVNIGPRFGFAWDVFGDGKTAVRGGAGIFYNVFGTVDTVGQLVLQPPPPTYNVTLPSTNRQELVLTPSTFNSTLPQMLAGGAQTFIGPQSVIGLPDNFKDPATYSFNLGVQRDLGHGLLLEVSYVGDQNRHNGGSPNFEQLPYGIDFLCSGGGYAASGSACGSGSLQYGDASNSGKLLPNAFLYQGAAYPGYTGMAQMYDNLNSNYNSLQTQISKRFGRTLTLNAAWTWSKVMAWSESNNSTTQPASSDPICNEPFAIKGTCIPVSLARAVDYNDAGNHAQNIVMNFTWHLPAHQFDRGFMRQALNGWVFEGTYEYASGAPSVAAVSTSGYNLTGGGGWGTRVNLNPNQSVYLKTGSNGYNFLNFNAFGVPKGGPGVCDGVYTDCGWGNSGAYNFVGPATDNLDVSLFKDFQLGKNEARKLEIRWETYNTLNHTEFTSINTTLNLNGSGQLLQSNNTTFGQATNTNPPRIMALAARLSF